MSPRRPPAASCRGEVIDDDVALIDALHPRIELAGLGGAQAHKNRAASKSAPDCRAPACSPRWSFLVQAGDVSRFGSARKLAAWAILTLAVRRPKTSPAAIGADTVGLIVAVRKEPVGRGRDAGPHTIAWHLRHHHQVTVSATISRYLISVYRARTWRSSAGHLTGHA